MINSVRVNRLSSILVAVLLAGCAASQPTKQLDKAQTKYLENNQLQASELHLQDASHQWWQSYDSEQLNTLVIQALDANHDLQAAALRFKAAMQQLGYEESQYWPQGGFQGEINRGSTSGVSQDSAALGAAFTWQLDFFGRISALVRAAEANSLQAQEQKTQLVAEVVSGVVRSYFEWQGNQLKRQIVQQQIDALTSSIDVLQVRVDEGFASKLDVNRTYAQLNQQKMLLPQLDLALFQGQATIATLLGKTPENISLQFESKLFDKNLVSAVALAEPEKAVSLRPEISIARLQFIRQSAVADAAHAALYPDVSISGFAGLINPIGTGLSSGDDAWSVTPQLNWSIFSWPALKAQAKSQNSLTQAAFADYENTIVSIIAESQTALVQMKHSKTMHEFAKKRLYYAEQAHMQAKAMYEEGSMPFLDLLSARQDALVAEQSTIDATVAYMQAKISTYKAFSGGWSRALVLN